MLINFMISEMRCQGSEVGPATYAKGPVGKESAKNGFT